MKPGATASPRASSSRAAACRDRADRGDAVAAYGDVGPHAGVPGAVVDRAAADHEIVGLGLAHGRVSYATMIIPGWLETYRGAVARWEVDDVDHFTVAFYFDRLEHAMLGLLETVGLGPDYMARARHGCVPVDTFVRYMRELRVGDILHVESGVIDADEAGLHVGHKLFDSETRTVCASFEQRLAHVALPGRTPVALSAAQRQAIEARRVSWDGPAREPRRAPQALAGFLDSGRDVVKPIELNLAGESALSHYVHRFSAAGGHLMSDIGFTPAYMRNERRGFSTFEFQMTFGGPLLPGTPVQVKECPPPRRELVPAHVPPDAQRAYRRARGHSPPAGRPSRHERAPPRPPARGDPRQGEGPPRAGPGP